MLNDIALGIIITLLFISLIVLFTILLVKLYIHKIKSYTKVIYDKDIDFQKTLNSTIIETQEQVLANISQDLHDDAGQQLTYINFQIENLKLDSPNLAQVLHPVSDSVANLSASIRRISHSLNNQLLSQQDLMRAIKAECERLQQSGRLNVNLKFEGTIAQDFEKNEQIVIYRIFQEVINNILKHSNADTIAITVDADAGFRMIISDNGYGFDVDAAISRGKTIGIQNLMHRAELIDYRIAIDSSKGKGTTITLTQNKF